MHRELQLYKLQESLDFWNKTGSPFNALILKAPDPCESVKISVNFSFKFLCGTTKSSYEIP